MITTLSYEIGAMFLLAALLMFGTLSGAIPSSFQAGKLVPIILGVLVLGFGIYHFGPNLSAAWRSTFANAKNIVSPRQPPAAAPHLAVPAASHAKANKPLAPHWKTIVVDDSLFTPTKSTPASANPVTPVSASPGVAEQASATQLGAKSSSDSPPDHGIKRAVKSVGRFLHINRGNKAPKREE